MKASLPMAPLSNRRWWLACILVGIAALAAIVPTAGDLGLTWDEPVYRDSQVLSGRWWEQVGCARSWSDLKPLLDADTLAYHWPYGRFGINFHPPLAGQASVVTHAATGRWLKDMPSRRLASGFEFALTITILFGFLASRYGPAVGGVAAASLLLMPRVYGDAHVAGTDLPGLLLWGATAIAFWKGLHEPNARRWRVAVGLLMGLAFVEKMGAVAVLLPLMLWLVAARLPRSLANQADWIDGIATTAAMLPPLALAGAEILRLMRLLPRPNQYDPFDHRFPSPLPGAILLAPLAVWLLRRGLARLAPRHPVWGVERPALETWAAILAFAPAVGWLGNPAWWRETLPRLAHYAMLNSDRRGALPDIRIFYLGRTYLYSLPWPNAWVLVAATVPAGILLAATCGVPWGFSRIRRDRLPLFFLIHLLTLPALRMLRTPAHDGVRLLLPTFFFLAAFAGWGLVAAADRLARVLKTRATWTRSILATLVLGSATWQLAAIHPFELSYFNELVGGPAGAWRKGFELSYWYDAFNPETLQEINARLPKGAAVTWSNELSQTPTFHTLQALGALNADLDLSPTGADGFPFMWLLTHDSKATGFTRLLFALHPWYERRPAQLGGLRVAAVADPVAVSRAWALWLLADGRGTPQPPPLAPLPAVNEPAFRWARDAPSGLAAAADAIVGGSVEGPDAQALMDLMTRGGTQSSLVATLLRNRPRALVEAVAILIARPDAVRAALLRPGYTDPATIGGDLDRDLPPAEGRRPGPAAKGPGDGEGRPASR